jgi:uncharacterized delta-60 repeat protein
MLVGLFGSALTVSMCGRVVPETSATTTTTLPTSATLPAPQNLSAAASTLQVTLAWDSVTSAESYNLYWDTFSGVTKAGGTKIASVTSPYTHEAASSPLTNGRTYYYVVTAADATSESVESAETSATPDTLGITDEAFNSGGSVFSNNAAGGADWDYGYAVATDPSGKILVAGRSRTASGKDDLAIWKYNADGSTDESFGTDGIVIDHNAAGGNGDDFAEGIALDSAGKILATGTSNNGVDTDMVIWKFNANGSLDTSFGDYGIAVHHNAAGGGSHDAGKAITLDSNGKILIAGYSRGSLNYDIVVWRFKTDGTTDETFGGDGVASHDDAAGGSSDDYAYGITTDTDGKILVCGQSYNGSNFDMAIWRFNTDGSTDETFDGDGVAVYPGTAGNDVGYAIITDDAGKILVVGRSLNADGNDDLAVWRYNNNGSLDTSFGVNGIRRYDSSDGGSLHDYGYAVALDHSNRILVAGYKVFGSADDIIVLRYGPDGSLDSTFGANGLVAARGAAGGNSDQGRAMAIDPYGRIVVAGTSENALGDVDMVIWRFK